MSKAKTRPEAKRPKRWWGKRRNRNRVWLGLVGGLAVTAVSLFLWFATQSLDAPEADSGQQVNSFELPDVVSGESFSLADYLGKQDIVIVSYMGFF